MGTHNLNIVPSDLVFIDLETTGLDNREDDLLEVAVVVTNELGDILDQDSWVVAPEAGDEALARMADNVREMHEKSGLLNLCAEADIFSGDVDILLDAWLKERGASSENKLTAAGFNPKFDLDFAQQLLPRSYELFNYRTMDVRSFEAAIKRLNPFLWERFNKPAMKAHRALPDCHEAIRQYKWFIDEFFIL